MNQITNALFLREEARPIHIALTYGILGIVTGALLLGNGNE